MSASRPVFHRLDFDLPTLQPCHAGKQFTQPLRQRPLQGRAIQFSSVHGNGRFHDAVNIAYIVNMLKRLFPIFFGLWEMKNARGSFNQPSGRHGDAHRRGKLRQSE